MATQVSDSSGKRVRGGSADDLAVIAQRAQAFTNASGTAIALSEGSLDEIICRARSGSTAPEVGAAMRVEGSFTGLCIQTGKELRCDDAETDTRVDTVAIRALGIRSMVVIPIKEEGRVTGVLAVFAPTAHAFTITHVAVLKTMADQISALLQRQRTGREDGESHESPRPAPVVQARAAAASVPAVSSTPVMPPAVVIKPAAPASRPQPPVAARVEPVIASVVAADISASPTAKKKRAEVRDEHHDSHSDYRINLGTLDAASEKKPAGHVLIIAVAAAAVIAAVGGVSYYKLHQPATASSQQQAAVNSSASAASASNPQPVAPVASNPLPSTATAITSASPVSNSSETSASRKTEKNAGKTAPPAASQGKHEEAQTRHDEAQPPREQTVALSAGSSRISAAKDNTQSTPEAAPTITVSGSSDSGSLNSLASPVAISTPSMVAQSELVPFKVVKKVTPVYPTIARQRMLSGSVVVQGTIDVNGKIRDLRLVSGSPIFRDAAFDAVKQWEFKPAMLNGQAIEQTTQIRLDFNPR